MNFDPQHFYQVLIGIEFRALVWHASTFKLQGWDSIYGVDSFNPLFTVRTRRPDTRKTTLWSRLTTELITGSFDPCPHAFLQMAVQLLDA